MEGWISLHRRLALHDLWLKEPFTRGQAWVDMLMLANHKPGWIMVRGIQVDIGRGQVGWSILRLSKRWKWSQGKVKRYLASLEKMHQIRVQKVIQNHTQSGEQSGEQKNSVTSLITIVNYESFQKTQKTENKAKRKRRTAGEQTETNNNVNKSSLPKNLTKDSIAAWSLEKGYPVTQVIFDSFYDHHVSKGNRFVSWERALQMWVRNHYEKFGGDSQPKKPKRTREDLVREFGSA